MGYFEMLSSLAKRVEKLENQSKKKERKMKLWMVFLFWFALGHRCCDAM